MIIPSGKSRAVRQNVKKALEDLRTDPKMQPITDPPLRPIRAIQFGILSPDEIKGVSVCKIDEPRFSTPATGTAYDERMGPTQSRTLCSTCNEEIKICPGHFGHIDLNVPIINPMFVKYIVIILNCVCLKCSKLKVNREEIELEVNVEHGRYVKLIDRLNVVVNMCTASAFCNSCTYPYPIVKEIDGQIFAIYETKDADQDNKKKINQSRLELTELQKILAKVSNEDISTIGFQPQKRVVLKHGKLTENLTTFRPEWLIITCLPVMPPMSRPPDHSGDTRCDDDLTVGYGDIVKNNNRLTDPKLTERNRESLIALIGKHIGGLFDNSDGLVTRSSGKVAKGISERCSGKKGLFRNNAVGKRVDCSARTVITADINLRLNEVGVPKCIAETLTFPEKVTPRNYQELKTLLDTGKINTIIRGTATVRVPYAIRAGRPPKLHLGDIVCRHLRDGDTVVFNRQPTLHRGSMMAHFVKVLPGKTLRMNLSATTPYNADFDGDEMQLHAIQNYGAVVEVQELMGVNKMIVSSQASGPIMGLVQDALLGAYLLTKSDTILPRHQFMDCVLSAGEVYVQKMAGVLSRASAYYKDNLFNGRVLFSVLLPSDFEYTRRNNADPAENTVVIKNGILVSGTIDKKIVGKSHGSVIHRLYKEYGSDIAADFLSASQFVINRWLSYRGFSVGMADFVISNADERGVHDAIQKAYIEVQSIEKSDDPPSLKEFRINNALNNRGQSLAINGLCENNRLQAMLDSGSKGSKMNCIQISGHLGQNNVGGKRIQCEIDNGSRTLPCFGRGNTHPKTKGFIESSFLTGLTPSESFFHAKAGREGIVDTAVKTRDTGYNARKLVKRMEDLTVLQDYTVRNSAGNIVSFSYGDSLDPTQMIGDTFADIDTLVMQLNAEFERSDKPVDMGTVMRKERISELSSEIKNYLTSINLLKKMTTPKAKKMLSAARSKLKELKARKEELMKN